MDLGARIPREVRPVHLPDAHEDRPEIQLRPRRTRPGGAGRAPVRCLRKSVQRCDRHHHRGEQQPPSTATAMPTSRLLPPVPCAARPLPPEPQPRPAVGLGAWHGPQDRLSNRPIRRLLHHFGPADTAEHPGTPVSNSFSGALSRCHGRIIRAIDRPSIGQRVDKKAPSNCAISVAVRRSSHRRTGTFLSRFASAVRDAADVDRFWNSLARAHCGGSWKARKRQVNVLLDIDRHGGFLPTETRRE